MMCQYMWWLRRDGSVVSVSTSHKVGRGIAARPGYTKDNKNGTNCLPAWHAVRKGWSLAVQPDCLKGWVKCVELSMGTCI